MQFSKLAFTLTAAALPALAFASHAEDAILASFERDMQREPTQISRTDPGENDPLIEIFYAALHDPRKAEFSAISAIHPQPGRTIEQ